MIDKTQFTQENLFKQDGQPQYFGKLYPKLNFVFSHNARDFVVEEIPLYPFSNEGEHRILKIRKKNVSTSQCIKDIAKILHIKDYTIGYAGLKDKNALTYQYISVPNKAFLQHQHDFSLLKNIKILESYLHNNKIKIGHLKGNKFFIRLKKVNPYNFERLQTEALNAQKYGFPNFFGYQRFGNFGDNYLKALKIKKPPKFQSTLEKLFISSLQSFYFNRWLEERLKISSIVHNFNIQEVIHALKQMYGLLLNQKDVKILKDSNLPLIPLKGDVCMHYPYGKFFYLGDKRDEGKYEKSKEIINKSQISNSSSYNDEDIKRLQEGLISITGLLSGIGCTKQSDSQKVWIAKDQAFDIESLFLHEIMAQGTRRYAWVYPNNLKLEYFPQEAHATMSFELPSGSYATSFLSYLKNDKLK